MFAKNVISHARGPLSKTQKHRYDEFQLTVPRVVHVTVFLLRFVYRKWPYIKQGCICKKAETVSCPATSFHLAVSDKPVIY